jgi:urease accessory protein
LNYRVEGRLRLDFNHEPAFNRTRMTVLEAQPPMKVIRAFEVDDGAALLHLHNVSGGVLGGDHLTLGVRVGAEARVQLTTTSATRIYRSRPNSPASTQINDIAVAENGLLEMVPDQLIPYAQSSYQQRTHIRLDEGAGLFWWEIVAPGREARGEEFAYDLLALELEIRACDRPIAIENMRLEPHLRPMASLVRLGGYRYFSTFYICRVGLPAAQWTALEAQLFDLAGQLTSPGDIAWGVSTLVKDGLVIRGLSREGRTITRGLVSFWRAAKKSLYGQDVVLPRKIY